MRRKWLISLLAASLTCTALAGCASPNPEPKDQAQAAANPQGGGTGGTGADDAAGVVFPLAEPYVVSAFAYSTPGEELDKSLFMKTMEERTNVKWDLTLVSGTERLEKLGLSFNSGEYYDVYLKSGISEIDANKYAKQEIIMPLNDLIDKHMPNLRAVLDAQGVWNDITSGDGNIYALPQLNGNGISAPSAFINEPWLKAVGKQMPTTQDAFVDVLRAFRDGDPNGNGENDEIPMYLPGGGVEMIMPYLGIAMDYNTMSMYDHAAGSITYVPTSEAFKTFLRFMATLYSEKLINPDCFTASWDELNAMGATKDVMGVFPTWGAYLVVGNEKDENFPMLLPFQPKCFPFSSGVGYGGLVITDRCQRPDVIAAWTDLLYDEEGGRLAWMGVEGETYTIDDQGKYHWNTDGTYGTDITSIRNKQGLFGNQPAPCVAPKLFNEGQANPEEIYLYQQRLKMEPYACDPFPALSWTDEEIKEKSTLIASINPYFSQFEADVITGQVDLDAEWDAYLQTMKDMGLERLLEIDKAAYDRWLSQNR